MSNLARLAIFAAAAGAYLLLAFVPWNPQPPIRHTAGVVAATLILWVSEVAPLGVVAIAIPVAATLAGVLPWATALSAWGDEIIFLFLGAFLLARALDKHGVLDRLAQGAWSRSRLAGSSTGLALIVMLVAGSISMVQSNTAVTAMCLPVVLRLGRGTGAPAIVLLALSYGATFGGMATPVGTAPNFVGYAEMKKSAADISFLTWMKVGVPVWVGTTLITWGLLELARRFAGRLVAGRAVNDAPAAVSPSGRAAATDARSGRRTWIDRPVDSDVGPGHARVDETEGQRRAAGAWAIAVFLLAAVLWLYSGAVLSLTEPEHAAHRWIRAYLPDSLVPIAAAWLLFVVRVGPQRRAVLDRHDFQALDWDTLFLIAGGLCLGKMLSTSGAAAALAEAVGRTGWPPLALMASLALVTVLLSELTSNTATALLMVPIAGSLAETVGMSPVQAVWLVALSASLGFALPVSTPPNAIVYGTRMIPLRLMIVVGLLVDVLSLAWVVCCVRWLA